MTNELMQIKTTFLCVPVEAAGRFDVVNFITGKAIGNGKCKGVKLRFNFLQRDASTSNIPPDTVQNLACFYVGDANRQEYEALAGTDSPLILCNDLSEVWVRIPLYSADAAYTPAIQVIVYD